MQKTLKITNHMAYGYSSESYPMRTNMTGLKSFSKNLTPCVLIWVKVASALEGVKNK